MKKNIHTAVLLIVLAVSCKEQGSRTITEVGRDTTINTANAFTNLFLDSAYVASYIEESQMEDSTSLLLKNFYNSRNYQFAWFTEDGVAEQTQAFFSLQQQYIQDFQDSSMRFPGHLQTAMEQLLFRDTVITEPSIPLGKLELQLTQHFFGFVSYAYTGKVDPEILQWHIPRKKVDAVALLDSLVENNGQRLEEWEPVNRQYRLLKKAMLHLYEVEKMSDWEEITVENQKSYKEGDSSIMVSTLKKKLFLTGDYQGDTTAQFTSELTAAVKRYQYRMGLKEDGIVGQQVVNALNVPIKKRIEQLLINMERMRWMPNLPEGNGIMVNIPQYQLHVYENGQSVMNMPIVVGTTGSQTVIFSDELKYVVFSPFWNIPSSIVRSEILPAIQRDKDYLTKKNMEQVGVSHGIPLIRQRPGPGNSLGRVKFIFPNSYNIYLHDTPSKSLFELEKRAFSHGCIRVGKPAELAAYLLKDSKVWTPEKISQAMRSNNEKWVTLEKPVPVFISYFTAWVDGEGRLHYREDLYRHDERMAARLFNASPSLP